jgi:hypothetical protein
MQDPQSPSTLPSQLVHSRAAVDMESKSYKQRQLWSFWANPPVCPIPGPNFGRSFPRSIDADFTYSSLTSTRSLKCTQQALK